ncbi:MAG: sodium:solute symporter [Cyclobacteriaceae bacterium]|nr:sodium:solute symporter [Cyclobacteriaceae bacterium]
MMDFSIRIADIITVVIYLVAMMSAGIYFSRRNHTTEAYFVGNRSFSGWVIGLSMLGTIISSATFLALPAAAFVLDWRQLSVNLVVPFVAVLAILIFIPFFRNGKRTSAFEYLGDRFGTVPRLYGTLSFMIMQLIRMAQILFLVSLVLQFLTGWPIVWVIAAMGIFIGLYTFLGGFEAVVWTDVIQALILIAGGIISVLWISFEMSGGVERVIEIGLEHNKFSLGDFRFDLGERTFYTLIILGMINWLGIYAGDQNMVQRYVSAKSTAQAKKATIIYTAISLPMWALFFFIGTALFSYYQLMPDAAIAGLEADQILPYFILTKIPPVVAGLIISAVIAASMSSMDSGINAIATVCTIDILKPYLAKHKEDRFYLNIARWIVVGVTLIVVSGAIFFSKIDKESMNDISLIVTSVFGGCLMGLFMMGFFTTRIDGNSAIVGIALAVMINIYLGLGVLGVLPEKMILPIHSYWVAALVNVTFILVAYTMAIIRKPKKQPHLQGLTVWTLSKKAKNET